jgi:hypothetical protein
MKMQMEMQTKVKLARVAAWFGVAAVVAGMLWVVFSGSG